MELLGSLKERLLKELDTEKNLSDEEIGLAITNLIQEQLTAKGVSASERLKLKAELFNSVRGLDVLEDILADDEITEVMVNGREDIFIEKNGRIFRYRGAFSSAEKLDDVVQTIAGRANKRVNESVPIVDTRLPDGSRVNIVLKPVAINGPVITIRKFPKEAVTMDDLIRLKSITEEAALFLKKLVINGFNIFISGGTGSGKTTALNALSGFIPKSERIITIEDSAELKLEGIDNLISLECRQANSEGENAVTIRDLIRASLRMRPTRIIVGEVRGSEALDMLQAMNTGHDGSLSTGHANSPEDMLTRLETMVLMGCDMPLAAIRAQIASALDLIVHLARMRDGSRKVLEISEVCEYKDGRIRLNPLFKYVPEAGLVSTGNKLENKAKLDF